MGLSKHVPAVMVTFWINNQVHKVFCIKFYEDYQTYIFLEGLEHGELEN